MLENLKMLLGIEDTTLDAKLNLIIKTTKSRLQLLLGGIEPPESLSHVIVEVAIIRFNRIGSEGLASHAVEGESLSFVERDFDGFSKEIQAFLDTQAESTKGKVRFL